MLEPSDWGFFTREIAKQKRLQNWRDRLVEMLRDTMLERALWHSAE
ncbi:MAG: hypothetical protein ACXVZX_05725 [Terriglobales bacterium]